MGRKLDALLVLPPMYQSGRTPDYNPKEPMGLMYLAAELRRRGLSVEILDADLQALTIEETVGEIVARPAAVIGFSVLQRALPSLKLVVEGLRGRGVSSHICCGGVGATLSVSHVLNEIPAVDSVVLGDGELTFAELVERVVSDAAINDVPGLCVRGDCGLSFKGRPLKPDLDSLAAPSRDLSRVCLDKTGYVTVVGSRGCYAACTFCSNSGFERVSCGPGWRGRDPVSIVDEIEYLHREFGATAIKFNDPNLFGPGKAGREHVVRLCGELIRRGLNGLHLMAFTRASDLDRASCHMLREAGFERILIGVESFDPKTLKMFRKGETVQDIERGIRCLRGADISIVPGFIIFNPYTTLATLRNDLVKLEQHGFAVTLSKSMRVFDGTALEKIMEDEERLYRRSPFEGYHEFSVSRDVATVYMCLKTVAVKWLAPIVCRYQDRLWDIKKAPSFSGRRRFYSLQDASYEIESRVLKSAIDWVESGFSRDAVRRVLLSSRNAMRELESAIIGAEAESSGSGIASGYSVKSLTESITGILTERPYDTFPEKYRWADD
ncbi:MAG: radical SAM protein [Patescibacteria group bacterium]|nr:radical SAM protein [Patescibacteria group bacterium]